RPGLGAGTRSIRVKISLTCDTVTAGVFPPDPPPLAAEEPQRQQRERHVVVPADPAPDLILPQPALALARPEYLLDPVPGEPDPDQLLERHLRPGVAQGVMHPGLRLDGPHHHQPLLRPAPPAQSGPHPHHHRVDPQRPLLAAADRQPGPAA